MPELPDLEIYREAIEARVLGRRLEAVRIVSPFLLRTVDPKPAEALGATLSSTRRVGKRIVLVFDGGIRFVIHLMVAGRFRYEAKGAKIPGKLGLAAFDFESGSLVLTEASPKKRASLYVVRGDAAVDEHDPGGIEPLTCDLARFTAAMRRENRTLKRALTDPTIVAGIGNSYSDEILHAARLSPTPRTRTIDEATYARLFEAMRTTLTNAKESLRRQFDGRFPGPGEITAFRPEFAVHGRYGRACPVCGSEVQRIRFADNESNYCPTCQTDGKLLADRSLSRLLGSDWPKTLDELEARRRGAH